MPRKPRPSDRRHAVSDQLRDVVDSRGLTAYELGAMAGVDRSVIGRFLRGERGLAGDTIDRLCSALGLRLVEVGRGAGRRSARPSPATRRGEGEGPYPPAQSGDSGLDSSTR